jgi:hypothetical protein
LYGQHIYNSATPGKTESIIIHLFFINYVEAFDSVAQKKIMGSNDRKGLSDVFNKNSPKYVAKYNHNYRER